MKPNSISIYCSLAIAAGLAASTVSNYAQNVNVTGTLAYVAGAHGVFDYTLTLSNSGPEAVESLWLGWVPGLFDIANPTITGNTLGWSSVLDGASIQYEGTSGTALASGASATFTFESTSNPAQFQSGTAGPSTAYGVNDTSQLSLSLSPPDTQVFTPTVVAASTQNVNVTGALTYVAETGGVFDYTLTLSNAGPEAVESLWLGWTVGVFDIANPTSVANTVGWNISVDGNSVQFGGTAGTALASGGSGVFTFKSTSTPADFQAGTAGSSVAYGVNTSQFAVEGTTQDSEQFAPTLTVTPPASATKEDLTVTVNPVKSGAVTPNFNNKSLIVNHSYTVTAVAAKGQVFASWSGIVQSANHSLTFVMPDVSNATLTANFIPSPFASNEVAGAYSGLFIDTNNLSNDTLGSFSATVADNGVISGQVKIAGVTTHFSATLQANGSATLELKRPGQSSIVLTIQVDLTGLQTLTGTVSDTNSTFNAQLTALRAGFTASQTAANYAGHYTWAMPGAAGNAPAGYSYGTATIVAAGGVSLTLFLSDGTAAAASGTLSTNGQMPLYLSLYGGKGSLLSWLSFTNSSNSLSTNVAYWFKGLVVPAPVAPTDPPDPYPYRAPELVAKDFYNAGFTLTNLTLLMGTYTAEPKGTDALNAATVSLQLSGADLTSSVSNVITLNSSGVGGSSTGPTLNISDKTGLFSGSFKDPASGKTVHFNGVALQPAAAGFGFFISTDLSGAVVLDPQ
jgi:hypothetical protein